MDVTDLVSEGNINYLATLAKDDPDELEKNAHIPSKDEVEMLPGEEFALVMYHPQTGFLKKYATHDKFITKLNMKIFADKCAEYPDEIAKTAAFYLAKAAKDFRLQVPKEIEKLATGKHISNIVDLTMIDTTAWANKRQALTKTAEEIEYALPERKKYPIHTPEMVKKAAEYFNAHVRRFDPLEALQFAGAVKKAAAKHSVPLSGTILNKYATLTAKSFSTDLRGNIKMRKGFVTEDQASVYDELLEKSASLGVIKTAEYLSKVDRKFGVHRLWNSSVDDPFISVLGHVKEANCATHKGKKITKGKMLKAAESIVDADTLKELSGPDGLEVFDSLPTPIKNKIADNA